MKGTKCLPMYESKKSVVLQRSPKKQFHTVKIKEGDALPYLSAEVHSEDSESEKSKKQLKVIWESSSDSEDSYKFEHSMKVIPKLRSTTVYHKSKQAFGKAREPKLSLK